MSELPNVPGQSVCGAGRANGMPVRSDARQASIAGQSAALRASFHTAAPSRTNVWVEDWCLNGDTMYVQ
jgi:hypothetical protein